MNKWEKKYRHKLKNHYLGDLGEELEDFYLNESKKNSEKYFWITLIGCLSIIGMLLLVLFSQ